MDSRSSRDFVSLDAHFPAVRSISRTCASFTSPPRTADRSACAEAAGRDEESENNRSIASPNGGQTSLTRSTETLITDRRSSQSQPGTIHHRQPGRVTP